MNSLLIYNNNVAYTLPSNFEILKLGESYSFQIGKQELMSESFSVDRKIHRILTTELKNEQYEVIFLPYSLSDDNYLEFIGLRFAYHIRLTPEFNNIQTPIVFYGFEDAVILNKLSELGLILFTKHVYQTERITIEDFKKQIEFIKRLRGESDSVSIISVGNYLASFISKISITASGNYNHNHNVINEWSIYRWAMSLHLENEAIKKIDNNIASNLYFKYLKAKYPIKKGESFDLPLSINKGSILYIDDELEKGWDSIFKAVCGGQKYSSFGRQFKNWDTRTIILETIVEIKKCNPDVVILDIRLHDDDFETNDISEVTGFKILKEIKENINPGIQVIIFSATNRVLNLQALQKEGADDFILKESPELSADAGYSKVAIERLKSSLVRAFKMSFLKDVYLKIKEIEGVVPNGSNEEESQFYVRLKNHLDVSFKLLNETYSSVKYFNYGYLQLFQIIEDFSNLSYVFKEDSDSYVYVNGKEVLVQKVFNNKRETAISFEDGKYKLHQKIVDINPKERNRRLDTNFKISAIIIFRLGFESSSYLNWTDIYTIRNTKAAHFSVNDSLTEDVIYILLQFIKSFINPMGQKETNIERGLKAKSYEESLELLKSRFRK